MTPLNATSTLVNFNRNEAPRCVHEVFSVRVKEAGESIAVISHQGRLTYSELHSRSNGVAHRLAAWGVSPGDTVALCADRSPGMIVVLLGILKAGASYVPIVPAYPAERIAFMLSDSAAKLVVLQSEYASQFPEGIQKVLLADLEAVMPESEAPVVESHPESCAYVMYTSGSTGMPKGAAIPHRAIERLCHNMNCIPVGSGEVILHAAPIAFDASTIEVWGPLLAGGTVALHGEAVPTASGLGRSIRDYGVTGMWLTAALFNMVVDQNPDELAPLKYLITGGEALSVEHVRRAQNALPKLQLVNGYGPTETTTFATCFHIPRPVPSDWTSVPIGSPIRQTELYIVDDKGALVSDGETGELYIGGFGLALHYLNRPDLTEQAFVPSPVDVNARVYRTGDLVRLLPSGVIDYVGRKDKQLKIRGYRVEPGEVEHALTRLVGVKASAITAHTTGAGEKRLVAYWVPESFAHINEREIREQLGKSLPDYLVPSVFTKLDELPLTGNGKLDYRALPPPSSARPELRSSFAPPTTAMEVTLARIFSEMLEIDAVGRDDNFFELGGSSLLAVKLAARLSRELGREVSAVRLFELPTVSQLAARLEGNDENSRLIARLAQTNRRTSGSGDRRGDVAIIGMAGRFPGSRNVDEFWENLAAGREGITFFDPTQLDQRVPEELRADPNYVPARGVIADYDKFDAPFFGVTPAEAALMDPQQRVILELAWETLENGGYVPENTDAIIGIYAGKYNDTYFSENVSHHPDAIAQFGAFNTMLANEKDYVATRTAYCLNLTGPAISVHTACSTSLVCVVQALQSLRNFDCDLALAGGVSITVPVESGYLHQEGSMLSADGHTKTFSNGSTGTVFSDGAAMVLLKRLEDALSDGDTIRAVIRGGALNNDGSNKASLTAPSVAGQAMVIARAHQDAGVSADQISYVEAHGTATPLGDPVEVEALKQAFSLAPTTVASCGIGSVKSNVGHTVIAAGTTGLIKAALALEHGLIPPSLGFSEANPALGLAESPFYVTRHLTPWARSSRPRIAGVSAFGVGGTNAHVVVAEAPLAADSAPSGRAEQVLLVSGRSEAALQGNLAKLASYLQTSEARLEDIAFTLHAGRKAFSFRAAIVCSSAKNGAEIIEQQKVKPQRVSHQVPRVAFLFPGQGSQYPQMGAALYRSHSLFRSLFDHCAEILRPLLGADLRELVFAEGQDAEVAAEALRRTEITQPALFVVEYCLAELWKQWGVSPFATIGHSVGEFVSGVLAGVFSLEDALMLVAHRGRLMGEQAAGSMLSVRKSAALIEPRLTGGLCIASDNAPNLCVVAGPSGEIESFEALLTSEDVPCRPLVTSHAFHSSMMDPVTEPFLKLLSEVKLHAPTMRFVSTATGTWITDAEATDPNYWAGHLRKPVKYSGGIKTLLEEEGPLILIEAGPRLVLSTLTQQQELDRERVTCVASLGNDDESSLATLLSAAGKVFTKGVALEPARLHGPEPRRRVPLPTYAFDHKRYWLQGGVTQRVPASSDLLTEMAQPASPLSPAAGNAQAAPSGRRLGRRVPGSVVPVVEEQLLVMQRQLEVLAARRGGRR